MMTRRSAKATVLILLLLCPSLSMAAQVSDVQVAPLLAASKHVQVELEIEPREAAPGSAVKLIYSIGSYEDTDMHVRVRVEAAAGWTLLDNAIEKHVLLLESWDNLEGELYMLLPEDAHLGARQRIRMLVELVEDGGVVQGQDYVTVSRHGGVKPGVPTMSATATLGISQLGATGLDGTQGLSGASLSTKFGQQSMFSLFYDRGLREQLSNFRFQEGRIMRLSGALRHAGWGVTFGNLIPSAGDALTGPYVLGRGATATRPTGRLVAEFTAAQPNTVDGKAAGHLLRARLGMRTPRLTFALNVSDFGRPLGGYTTLPPVQQQVLTADEQDQQNAERRLTQNAASNRVSGLGLDGEFRPSQAHRFLFRAGGLRVSNAAGDRSDGAVAETSYEYSSKPVNLNARWRQMPPTVQGISLFGNELAADGNLRLVSFARLVGYLYKNALDTVGTASSYTSDGDSLGLRFTRGAARLEVRGNYRHYDFSMPIVRRTVSVSLGTSAGPLSVTGSADIGTQDTGWQAGRVAYYRGEMRWTQEAGTIMLTATQSEGLSTNLTRVDLNGTWKLRAFELTAGAWLTRGYALGGWPGAWANFGFPIGGGRFLIVAGDYSSLTWTAAPRLRGMLAIRQGFSLPMPFVRGTPIVKPDRQNKQKNDPQILPIPLIADR